MRITHAMVMVSDMSRSVRFYRDVIGLSLRFESPGWSEFATDGATLALHSSDAPGAPEGAGRDRAGNCRPGLAVPDLDEFHQRMMAQGVPCIQEPTVTFGVRLAQYADPDGLVITVSAGAASARATARSSCARARKAATGRAATRRPSAPMATRSATRVSGCRSGRKMLTRCTGIAESRASKSPGRRPTCHGVSGRRMCGIPMGTSSG